MKFRDYYKVMGVDQTASADEIKKAYRVLARKFHPDVSKEQNAEDKFKELGEAYEVLKDPEKREEYDNLRKMAEIFSHLPGGVAAAFAIPVSELRAAEISAISSRRCSAGQGPVPGAVFVKCGPVAAIFTTGSVWISRKPLPAEPEIFTCRRRVVASAV